MTTGQTFKNTFIVLLTLLAAYAFIVSLRIIIVLLIAIIIASAIRPFVTILKKYGLPIAGAIVLIYGVLATFIILLGMAVLPPIVNQVAGYLENESRLANRIIESQLWAEGIIADVTQSEVSLVQPDEVRSAVNEFVSEFRQAMPSMLDDMGAILGEAVLIFVMGAYWLTSHKKSVAFVTQLSPVTYRDRVQNVIDEIEETMGGYVRGIVLIATIVGLLNFAAMALFNIPNAATLAVIIALTTTIPMIGGLIGMGLVVLMTLVAAPQYVLGVIAISLIVQQIEAHYLGPRIMSDRVGLDPLLIIVYTAIGFVMFGVVGALIAVPVMGTVHILLVHLVIEPYKDGLRKISTEDGLPIIRDDADEMPQVVTHASE